MKSFRLFFAVAACAIGSSIPVAAASFISSNVTAQPIGGPGQSHGTGVGGQIVVLNINSGESFAQALTDYGVNKAQTSSTDYRSGASATSDWQIGFTLSENGLPLNTFVPLTISYSYDFTLSAFGGFGSPSTGYVVGAAYGIAGNNASQGNLFEVFQVSATSNADGSVESCKSKIPGAAGPQACLGSYSASGTVTPLTNFHIGDNRIESEITAGGALGAVDAYNTGLIVGILVPDGVTWTYDPGITGNPLNFHYADASSATPEPAGFAIFGFGLVVLGVGRRGLRKE
jgi:hypothetical protein